METWNPKAGFTPRVQQKVVANPFFHLFAYLSAGLGAPYVFWVLIRGNESNSIFLTNTLAVLCVGVFVSWYTLSKLREYAKSRQLSYVFPVNFLAFSGVLAIVALWRLNYSIPLFGIGTVSTLLVSYLITVSTRGAQRLQFVVQGGRANEVATAGNFVPAIDHVELQSLIEADRVDGAIIADLHHDHAPEWERLFAKAALKGIPVYHYRQVAEMQNGQVVITHLSENDLGSLIPNVPYTPLKRLIDVVGALILLPFCLILFCFVGLIIKLDSKGSVFFTQDRVGFRGEMFRIIKFRTMRDREAAADDEAQLADAMTKTDDDRITRFGQFLRRTRLDELPQIFNVLNGEMSFIGPRPEASALSAWYERELPFYSYRHIVRPGITGWAQVNQGHVTDVEDVDAKLRYDFYYVKFISLWLDLLIVMKTVRTVIGGMGAK
ncbi:MAG: exopolysaccharide biosynthesis polyprenyl glycosylphosphotransferase [Pseudomonadota bacterium]